MGALFGLNVHGLLIRLASTVVLESRTDRQGLEGDGRMLAKQVERRIRFLPVLGVFAADFGYALRSTGAFGAQDLAARAAITGAAAVA